MTKHVSGGHKIGVRRARPAKPQPPALAEPWTGWVYSKCNVRGHPAEEHWHPPVGASPADPEEARADADAPVGGLDVERLARALDRVDKGIETRYPGATETSRQRAALIADAYRAEVE